MMRSGNPSLRDNVFSDAARNSDGTIMTIQGTTNKTLLLLMLIVLSASFVWGNPTLFMPLLLPAVILGFVVAIITVFKKDKAYITAPIYAIVEGVVLGGISSIFESKYPGIVIQAVLLTFGTLFCLLLAYKSRLIKATENFKLGVVAATGGIAIVYIISMVLSFFGMRISIIYSSSLAGILFSLFVVVIASLNLVLDFDFIEKGSEIGAPKYMEWYGAFGLIVTLIWLYLEILRLLAKMKSR